MVAAPFIGNISRFVPSNYYYTNDNSLSQVRNNSNSNNGLVGTAEATTISYDKNGIKYIQPFSSFRLTYSNETWTFNKNFRSDGSMRCDFEDRIRNSVYIAGYFKIKGSDDSEEVSAKLNGGPHTSSSPEN